MSGSEPRLPLSEPVKNLVVTYGLRAPLDEAGAIQAVQHIKELAGHTVVLNWGATPFVHEFDRATIINARKGNSRLASHVSFAKFTALTAARCVRWRPSRTLLFPLCFPNLFMQLQATLLSRLSRDFLQIIFQTRTPSPSWRALSRFKVGVLGPCLQQEWAKLGLSTERVALRVKQPKGSYDSGLLRRKYGLPEHAFVVSHIGHSVADRGIGICMELAATHPDIHFLLVVSSRGQNVPRPSANVHVWTDYIDDIYEVYHISNLYIFPIRRKGAAIDVPLTIVEAKIMDTAVLVSDLPHLRSELSAPGVTFFTPDNVNDIFTSLVRDLGGTCVGT